VPASFLDGRAPPLAYELIRLPGLGELLVQGLGVLPGVPPEYTAPLGNWHERAGALAFPRLLPTRPDAAVVPLLEREDRFLREFRGSVLLAWGLRDSGFGPELLAEWRERVPHAEVLELPNAGHFAVDDASAEILPRLRAFLAATAQP